MAAIAISGETAAALPQLEQPVIVPQVGHTGPISSLTYSPDGRRIASGSWDGTIRIWDVGSRRLLRMMGTDGAVTSVSFILDGRRIVDRKSVV